MIGWIILGAIVYIIIGILIVSFIMDADDYSIALVFIWPLLGLFLLIGGCIEVTRIICLFVRKYIWRK